MRRNLIEYVTNPNDFVNQKEEIEKNADSQFEIDVVNFLVINGYHIVQQWVVGSYRIDFVAVYGEKKIAIECDGDYYHSGEEKIRSDMERQAILERLGWQFIRIRGSEYYSNPESTMKRVISQLNEYEIYPENNMEINYLDNEYDLLKKVKSNVASIFDEWETEEIQL